MLIKLYCCSNEKLKRDRMLIILRKYNTDLVFFSFDF